MSSCLQCAGLRGVYTWRVALTISTCSHSNYTWEPISRAAFLASVLYKSGRNTRQERSLIETECVAAQVMTLRKLWMSFPSSHTTIKKFKPLHAGISAPPTTKPPAATWSLPATTIPLKLTEKVFYCDISPCTLAWRGQKEEPRRQPRPPDGHRHRAEGCTIASLKLAPAQEMDSDVWTRRFVPGPHITIHLLSESLA
jgi:hypothetical protein